MVEHTIADRAVPCSNHGRVFIFELFSPVWDSCDPVASNLLYVASQTATTSKLLSLAHHHMGFQSLFSALLCFIAAAHAGQLTVRSPRLTISSPDGSQLSSEQYVTRFLMTRKERNNYKQNIPHKNGLILLHWVRAGYPEAHLPGRRRGHRQAASRRTRLSCVSSTRQRVRRVSSP